MQGNRRRQRAPARGRPGMAGRGGSLSVSRLSSKNKRYDQRIAADRKFYAKSNQYQSYIRAKNSHAKEFASEDAKLKADIEQLAAREQPRPEKRGKKRPSNRKRKHASSSATEAETSSSKSTMGQRAADDGRRKAQKSTRDATRGPSSAPSKTTSLENARHQFASKQAAVAERRAEQQRRRIAMKRAKKARYTKTRKITKRTAKGQPVMKNVLGGLLAKLTADKRQKS